MDAGGWIQAGVGAGVLAMVLRDLFHHLLHPQGTGIISRAVMSLVWRAARAHSATRPLAGPFAVGGVMLTWFVLLVLGWTLLLEPVIRTQFTYGPDIPMRSTFVDALYVSTVGTATLGYGDIVPSSTVTRMVVPLQAVLGFVLLTAGMTWILSIYSPLARRRALARNISLASSMNSLKGTTAVGLARDLETVANDLSMFASTYFFHDDDTDSSLPHQASRLLPALEGIDGDAGTVLLRRSLERFSRVVAGSWVSSHAEGGDAQETLTRYARDHGH